MSGAGATRRGDATPVGFTLIVLGCVGMAVVAIVQLGVVISRERRIDLTRCELRGRCEGIAAMVASLVRRGATSGGRAAPQSEADAALSSELALAAVEESCDDEPGVTALLFDEGGAVLACSERYLARGPSGARPGTALAQFVTQPKTSERPMDVLINALRGGGGAVRSLKFPDGPAGALTGQPRACYVCQCGHSLGLAMLGPPGKAL